MINGIDLLLLSSLLGSGIPSAPGVASGKLAFSCEDAEVWAKQGQTVILCRENASCDDIRAFEVSLFVMLVNDFACVT